MNTGIVKMIAKATPEEKLAAKEIEYFACTARIVCSSREALEQARHPNAWRSLMSRIAHNDVKKVLELIGFEIDGGEEVDGKRVPFVARIKGGEHE